uniref:Calmodulin-interacting protein 111-like n=1 Tax=Rhizophora mucronata TaxID=61149 RepID=A0A2P2LBL1_RHIMU
MEHLKSAIRQVQPTDIQSYEELSAKFQRLVHSRHKEGLRFQNCSNRSNWFSLWTPIRYIMQFFHLLLPSGTKSTPSG